jgi:hypothetical protein
MKEIDTSEDLVIDLRMTLKTIFKKNRWRDVDWAYMVQDRN